MYNRVKDSKFPGASALGALPPLKEQNNLPNAATDDSIKRAIKYISEDLRADDVNTFKPKI